MRYTTLFGKTVRQAPSDAQMESHKLLYRAGFIRESTAGRYYFLPLGWRVHEKIRSIIKDEMDKAGAQEMLSPVLHPLSLWSETNRTKTTGFELMTVKDRREMEFALGGTAEEMFVDLVRKIKLSYRDLPVNIYQFSTKFRDEIRARGGLLRLREFVMKDAYSFDRDETAFRKVYAAMAVAYRTIFNRMGLTTVQVEADNGYIGGQYCHEFQVESPVGEAKFFVSEDGAYAAHEEVARFVADEKNSRDPMNVYEETDAKRGPTMEDGVKLHGLPMWQQLKNVMMVDENGAMILAVIRGDYDVNETKLKKVTSSMAIRPATPEEIRGVGSEPGFISPVGLKGKVRIIADPSVRTVRNMYSGANKKDCDALNINIGRDYEPDIEADIALAKNGYVAPDSHGKLEERKGIEVGNIFQLGYHYTDLMKGAEFIDESGNQKQYYMGCYGIGLARTMAAIVETHHDGTGIIWPDTVAPFRVHLITLPGMEAEGEAAYRTIAASGIDVLWDDRDCSAGIKFQDADLIGIPYRMVLSKKTRGQIELKRRSSSETKLLDLNEACVLVGGKSLPGGDAA